MNQITKTLHDCLHLLNQIEIELVKVTDLLNEANHANFDFSESESLALLKANFLFETQLVSLSRDVPKLVDVLSAVVLKDKNSDLISQIILFAFQEKDRKIDYSEECQCFRCQEKKSDDSEDQAKIASFGDRFCHN